MQQNRSKRYRAAAEQVDRTKAYNLPEAVSTLKKFPPTKFDQTVTVSFRLGVDPKQSDQMVRGTCPLPHGSGKQVRVLVFAEGAAAKAAKDAGAEYVGPRHCRRGAGIVVAKTAQRHWRTSQPGDARDHVPITLGEHALPVVGDEVPYTGCFVGDNRKPGAARL